MMAAATRSRLEQRRHALLAELHALPDMMRGKVYERQRKCGSASCTCASGGPRHKGLQLTVNIGGRTRTRYVRQGERTAIEAKIAVYHRLKEIVEELTEINLALINTQPIAPKGEAGG